MSINRWTLRFDGFAPRQEGLREALCTTGNGYFATRGAAPEAEAGPIHYPGTYLAGGYNRLQTEVADRLVENEDLVNFPNWLSFNFRIDQGAWFEPAGVTLLTYRQNLDLFRGMLTRVMRFRDDQGRHTTVIQRRLVSMAAPHLASLETQLIAEDWSGTVELYAALDGRVVNDGVPRYRGLNNTHLEPLRASVNGEQLHLQVQTSQSRVRMVQASRSRIYQGGRPVIVSWQPDERPGRPGHRCRVDIRQGGLLTVEKTTALYTSRDRALAEPGVAADKQLARAGRFHELLARHGLAWRHLWARFDLELVNQDPKGNLPAALVLRTHLFHLLQTVSLHTTDMDAGVPARGLHGEAYRGHIFWDELFIFPLLNLRLPEITRALLMYRYRRLDEARAAARAKGLAGAMYPWQSGSDGQEESQSLHLNPQSGRWIPDRSRLQRHVNIAIAYNVWQYFQASQDREFLSFHGAEMILEIARFWASMVTYNADTGRYEIHGVMGPDEYHDGYPDAAQGGVNNNAYTNIMAVWVLRCAFQTLAALPEGRRQELKRWLELADNELQRWEAISRRMYVPFHDEGIISQFDGYKDLAPFDWAGYKAKYGDIQRLDRILEAENDTPNRYQVSKQADVLMLFYLLSAEELRELLERLGYTMDGDLIPRNIHYYLARTSHGSTLSRIVHSWVLARADRNHSWQLFTEALESDVRDIQGGTTPEGIHLGAMAGTVDLVQRGYVGIETRGDVLRFNPCLPRELSCLRIHICYRGHALAVTITHKALSLTCEHSEARPIRVTFADHPAQSLASGARITFPLEDGG